MRRLVRYGRSARLINKKIIVKRLPILTAQYQEEELDNVGRSCHVCLSSAKIHASPLSLSSSWSLHHSFEPSKNSSLLFITASGSSWAFLDTSLVARLEKRIRIGRLTPSNIPSPFIRAKTRYLLQSRYHTIRCDFSSETSSGSWLRSLCIRD